MNQKLKKSSISFKRVKGIVLINLTLLDTHKLHIGLRG